MSSSLKNEIKNEILYCEGKALSYKEDAEKGTGGLTDYWKGKSETHAYIAIRLKRALAFHEESED